MLPFGLFALISTLLSVSSVTSAPLSSSLVSESSYTGRDSYQFNDFQPLAAPFLNGLAKRYGKLWFGSATNQPGNEDINYLYQEILNSSDIFGAVTPANDMKFDATEPQQGVFDYSRGDFIVGIAKETGKYLRCHNLIWAEALPDWLQFGTWTNDTLISVMKNHIYNLITHWQDACYSWDVVNEGLNLDGSFANSLWFDTIGREYFFLAYQFAAEAVESTGKDIKLYYNDFGIEYTGKKSAALIELIGELKARGLRIDGVGLESHFQVEYTPSYADQVAVKQAYGEAGVEVVVSELDARFANAADAGTATNPNWTGLAAQASTYFHTVKSCMDVEACKAVTVWDFDDQYSWVEKTLPGQGAANLYWPDLRRKPAYQAVADALSGLGCTVCG